MKKLISLLLAYLFLGLAIIGIVLPGVPTVPFLLLSAWFAAKGSKRLHEWLYAHPKFGSILINWKQERAISRKSKVTAVVMLIASWSILFALGASQVLLISLAILFICVSTFVVTRNEPTQR